MSADGVRLEILVKVFAPVYTSDMEDPITTQEAAESLGVTQRRIQALIKSGRLPAKPVGNSRLLLIERKDLELVRDRPPGRPKTMPTESPATTKPAAKAKKPKKKR